MWNFLKKWFLKTWEFIKENKRTIAYTMIGVTAGVVAIPVGLGIDIA